MPAVGISAGNVETVIFSSGLYYLVLDATAMLSAIIGCKDTDFFLQTNSFPLFS